MCELQLYLPAFKFKLLIKFMREECEKLKLEWNNVVLFP